MDPITLAITAISGLRLVLQNPALGGGSSVRLDQASELLGILGTLLQEGDEAIEELKIFTETVEAMAREGRPPNRLEWDVLRTRSDDAHARLQAAKAALLGEEVELELEPEEPTETVEVENPAGGTVELPVTEEEPESPLAVNTDPEEPETPETPDPSPAEETPTEEPVDPVEEEDPPPTG